MPKLNVQDIRNIALCGHGAAGKTTLADKLLQVTGAINRPASVDDGTSVCDFDEEEKAHKYTIESSLVHFDHAGKRFNLIDTPGYPDFIGQAIGALRAVETAAIVINAHSGIGVNTRRVFQEAGKAGCGRMIIVEQDGCRKYRFPGAGEVDPIDVRPRLHSAERADRRGTRFQGRRQHAQARRQGGRRRDRSGRNQSAADRNDHRSRRGSDQPLFRWNAADRRRNRPADGRSDCRGQPDSDRVRGRPSRASACRNCSTR